MATSASHSPAPGKSKVTQGTIFIIIVIFVVLPLAWNAATLVNVILDSCVMTSSQQNANEDDAKGTAANGEEQVGNPDEPSGGVKEQLSKSKGKENGKETHTNSSANTASTNRTTQPGGEKTDISSKQPESMEGLQNATQGKDKCVHGSTIAFSVGLFNLHSLFIIVAVCYSSRSFNCAQFGHRRKSTNSKSLSDKNKVDVSLINAIFNHQSTEQIQPDTHSNIYKEIKRLVENTWLYHQTQRPGKDAVCLHHTTIVVKSIFKIKNPKLWKIYSREKLMMPEHVLCEELLSKPILTELSTSPENEHLNDDSVTVEMESDNILAEQESSTLINDQKKLENPSLRGLGKGEFYLFHGTKIENIPSLIENGFDLINHSKMGLYGKAIYLAESSEKADQYADRIKERRSSSLTMLVVRVVPGRIQCHTDSAKPPRPPYRGVMGVRSQQRFDSIVTATDKRFREFLIFDPRQCYPEFVVIYDRT